MSVQHCAICGQLIPGPAQGGAAAAGEASGATPAQASAGAAPSTICVLCQGKLRASPNAAHTTRTTVLRPLASERLAGKVLAPETADQAEEAAVLTAHASQPPRMDSSPSGGADDGTTAGAEGTSGNQAAPLTPPSPHWGEGRVRGPRGSSISPNRPLGGQKGPLPVAQHFGSYEIISEISRGSFGVVYRARQQGLDRVVALKVLLAGAYASNEMVARFQREAKAVARLKHPNVVPVYDIGTHEGHHYFAMEFVEGSALSELIAKRQITTQRALEIAESLADALECAHRGGVIHRDIKPSNIIVDAHGQPHITDFGLAKQVDLDEKYTLSGTTLGTPAYMPPEQARGEINRIDARSDVYAIGAVLYEMLTGRTPFVGRSLLEVVVAVINEPAQPPRQLNPRIHRDVQTIVLKCLEKDPGLRYASAAELRDDIRRFRSGEAIRAKPTGLFRHTARFLRRHSVLVAAVALVCLAVGFSASLVKKANEESKKSEKKTQALQNELTLVKVSQGPIWLPDWWFPRKDPKELAKDEQGKRYTIPDGKDKLFDGLVKGKDAWDLQVQRVKVQDTFEVKNKTVRLSGSETLVSPEECRSFGDVDAGLFLVLEGWNADKKLRIGIQSLAANYNGVPYLMEIGGGIIRIIGPVDLYTYTSQGEAARKANEGPKLEVKAEKDAPELVDGRYALRIIRLGMSLSLQLNGLDGRPSAGLQIEDFNLSSWVFKNTQLVVRQPPQGLQFTSAEVKHKYGGKEGDAFTHFNEGEYNVAEGELEAITKRTGERSEDHLEKARAHYLLGLLRETLQPFSRKDLGHYTDAVNELARLSPEEQAALGDPAGLPKELGLRRMICFARYRQWDAVWQELRQGWSQGKIGEPLAWELDTVLELALREIGKGGAAKDPDKAPVIQAAQKVFERLGLTPGSTTLGTLAAGLADVLNGFDEPRFNELLALRDAYPSHLLNKPFYDAVNRTVAADQFDRALTLLGKMDDRTENDANPKTRATCVVLTAALEKHRYVELADAFRARPNLDVLRILCKGNGQGSKGIEAQAADLASQTKVPGSDSDRLNLFLFKVPPVVWAKLPADPSAGPMFRDALEKIAPEIISSGRVSNLVKLHEALRGAERQDPRMAKSFAEAVVRLAKSDDPGAERDALNLLKYCAAHVERGNSALQNAVVVFAEHRVSMKEPSNQDLIFRLQAVYPARGLRTPAREVLLALQHNSRYEEMVSFFVQARIEFGADAGVLTPIAVRALRSVNSPPQRAALMSDLWTKVHGELEQRQLAADDRHWQLEYADIELVLDRWEKARDRYLGLYNLRGLEPELQAKAGLRLGVLNLASPTAVSASDPLLSLLSTENLPDEYKLAAMLLAMPESLSIADLDARLKALKAPLLLSPPEWDLFRGLRLRMDGDSLAAKEALLAAERNSDASQSWVKSVASHLLRVAVNGPDHEPKEKPAGPAQQPPSPAPSAPPVPAKADDGVKKNEPK